MIYCFRPTLDPDSVEAAIKTVEDYILNLNGKILKTEKIGRKKLAYEINKFRDGFYVESIFQLEADKITALRRNLKLNENVIREMILKMDEKKVEKALATAAPIARPVKVRETVNNKQ
jgi:small subunit ribosomal protein S6